MTPRVKRLSLLCLALGAISLASALVLNALRSNLVFFFTPTQVATSQTHGRHGFRLGGMVVPGTLHRDGLKVTFQVTDMAYSIPVRFEGILPDLFKEGKGVVAQGTLRPGGVFDAREVLAKHDENYMPPEAAQAMADAARSLTVSSDARQASRTTEASLQVNAARSLR